MSSLTTESHKDIPATATLQMKTAGIMDWECGICDFCLYYCGISGFAASSAGGDGYSRMAESLRKIMDEAREKKESYSHGRTGTNRRPAIWCSFAREEEENAKSRWNRILPGGRDR